MENVRPVGRGFEKYLLDNLKEVRGIWAYQFPTADRVRWLRQPGDFLILHDDYSFLWEIKTTKQDTFYKLEVRDNQVEDLLAFDRRLFRNYAFVGIYFQRVDKFILVRIYDFITAPLTITPSDAVSLGTVVENFHEFLNDGYKRELGFK